MTREDSILVGIKGDPGSSAALQYAAREAGLRGVGLRLVHVVPGYVPIVPMAPLVPSSLEETGRQIVDRAAQEAVSLVPGDTVPTTILTGGRVPELVRAAEHAPMIVLGHDDRSTLERLVTGSTVTGVAARASCPVVVVPVGWEPEEQPRPVVVGVKSIQHSDALLRSALDIAAGRGSPVVLVHAWELPQAYDDLITSRVQAQEWSERAERALEESLAPVREAHPDVPIEIRVRHGQPARVLQQATEEAGLLLLARRPHAFPFGHLGGTGRTLLRVSRCPVEVLPPADEPAGAGGPVPEQSRGDEASTRSVPEEER
jgi:nucleotide-binding universal stress UspA family protein